MNAVLQRLFPAATIAAPIPCGVSGQLLNQPPCRHALQALSVAHGWPVTLQPVTDPPIEGVRQLLRKME